MQIRSNVFVEYSFPQCPKAKWDGEQSPPLRKEGGYNHPYISFPFFSLHRLQIISHDCFFFSFVCLYRLSFGLEKYISRL
jgi:hypothetical protein